MPAEISVPVIFVGELEHENSLHWDYRSSYPRFKRDCLLDRQLQNYVFLGGRPHS